MHNAFHGLLLEPYVETQEHGPNYDQPAPELVEGEPEYEVETLLGSRCKGRGRKLEYLVRWKGWGPAHDSWEPKENLHADDLVQEFHRREPAAIRRVTLGRQESIQVAFTPTTTTTTTKMPFYDFCECDDRASTFYPGEQLPVSLLRLPSASPLPVSAAPSPSFDPSRYQGPKPEPGWVKVDLAAWVDNVSRQVVTPPPSNDPGSDPEVLQGTARKSASPYAPSTPPSVAAGMSDAATELDLKAVKFIESQHPGAPWFCWSNTPAHAGFIVDIGGQKQSLPYLCYWEVCGKTF